MSTDWKPSQCLRSDSDTSFALMLLNQAVNAKMLKVLWNKASFKVTVDGGTNQLYNSFVSSRDAFIPDLITGDFDSIQSKVKSYYKDKEVEIIETPDQDHTDFTKALKITVDKVKEKQVNQILVLGAFGGRFDHIFANVNTLFEASRFTEAQIILFSEDTVTFLMQPGKHSIHVEANACGEWCGLVPIGEPCSCVTTKGLKWNLDKQGLKFGELISTSNTLENEMTDLVTIETDKPLLWTMGIIPSKIYTPDQYELFQMEDGDTDIDVLNKAWLLDNDYYDELYPECPDEDFMPTFELDGELFPLEMYHEQQQKALQTEIFATHDKDIYMYFNGLMDDLSLEDMREKGILVRRAENSKDVVITPLRLLEMMRSDKMDVFNLVQEYGSHSFIESVFIDKLPDGGIIINIECGS